MSNCKSDYYLVQQPQSNTTDIRMSPVVKGALSLPTCLVSCIIYQIYTANQLHRKRWRGYFLRSVHLFGSVSLETASAQGMLPMFWTGYCGGYSWWASVTCSHSQGSSPERFGPHSPQSYISVAKILQVPDFPESLVLPFLVFPIHKVNWENCNYGALEIADSCAKLNSRGAFPTSGFSV